MLPPLLTEQEVARAMRVSGRTIRRWAEAGKLDVLKIGGVRRYRTGDVERLLEPSNSAPPAVNGR